MKPAWQSSFERSISIKRANKGSENKRSSVKSLISTVKMLAGQEQKVTDLSEYLAKKEHLSPMEQQLLKQKERGGLMFDWKGNEWLFQDPGCEVRGSR